MNVEEHYVKLNVEKYGGMLCAPWFDRPLSVAGCLITDCVEADQRRPGFGHDSESGYSYEPGG